MLNALGPLCFWQCFNIRTRIPINCPILDNGNLEHVRNIIILTLKTTIMLTWAVGVHHGHGLWSNFCTAGPRLQMLPIHVSVQSFSATNWTHFRCYPWESSQNELPFTSCKRRCVIFILIACDVQHVCILSSSLPSYSVDIQQARSSPLEPRGPRLIAFCLSQSSIYPWP